MNRHSCITLMAVSGMVFGSMVGVAHAEEPTDKSATKAYESVKAAETAVEEARAAIKTGKDLISRIPETSEFHAEINQMITMAAENWKLAISSLEGAKESAAKIATASGSELANDYALLATVNAGVALSGAKVVQTAILFVDAAANNKTEALDIIRMAMQDTVAATSQVQFNYERVKTLIADKYSK